MRFGDMVRGGEPFLQIGDLEQGFSIGGIYVTRATLEAEIGTEAVATRYGSAAVINAVDLIPLPRTVALKQYEIAS